MSTPAASKVTSSETIESPPGKLESPYPGSHQMPRWNTGDLIDAPRFTWRNWVAMIGPGLVMGASAIGGGEWLSGPLVTAKYGGNLLWLCTLSILGQVLYNIEISRYALYTGEPIFTGKFRLLPGPFFWLSVYILLDFGSAFQYLSANAATPVLTVLLGSGELPNPEGNPTHWYLHKGIATGILVLAILPLLVGGKIFNSLKVVMSLKLVIVLGFLSFLAIFYSQPSTWKEVITGFFKLGSVPVKRGEDLNGNNVLDPGEDWDGDGHLDVVEVVTRDNKGNIIEGDVDGDGTVDGNNVENIFVSLFTRGTLPKIDLSLVALITAMAAIAGNGGLTNTPISNFCRDQGWGMGYHVGAIPSMIGGRGIELSQVGSVFQVTPESLPRWKRWIRHVRRDQLFIWMAACFVGIALPSMLSVEFLRRGMDAGDWNAASMTAAGVGKQVGAPSSKVLASQIGLDGILSGKGVEKAFWAMTLLCGFLVLGTSAISTIDGFIRRWVDVFWTASFKYYKAHPSSIKYAYFVTLLCYAGFGVTILWLSRPAELLRISTMIYNYALGFSCIHTLCVNMILLPRELRPGWLIRIGLVLAGCFFFGMATLSTLQQLGWFK